MSRVIYLTKSLQGCYHVGSAFSHQRIGLRMRATWDTRFYIKKLIWLAVLLAVFTVFLFPKVAAQWSNNNKPAANQNSAYLDAVENTQNSPASVGDPPAKSSGSAVSKKYAPSLAPNLKAYTKIEVRQLIIDYSAAFGIDYVVPLKIAYCESGLRWNAKNSTSTASGVFQFIRSTWLGTPEGRSYLPVFDADANVRAAIRKIAQGGISAWNASKSCWTQEIKINL